MFGDNLKKYRTEKGMSQTDVAEKMFVTRQCVSKWEKGVTQPDLQALIQLSEILDVSVDALVKDSETVCKKDRSNHNVGFFIANILTAIFCMLAFIATWRFLPKIIPAHWSHGVLDRYGSRNEVFLNIVTVVVLFAVDILVFFAIRRVNDKRVIYIAHGVIILFQITNVVFIVVLYAQYLSDVIPFATCLTADLLICVSVAMHPKIANQNHLLGVRTTDTLKSSVVWDKTNALACYLFTSCSAIIFIVNMIWATVFMLMCFLAYIPLVAAVVIYSKTIGKSAD